MKIDDYRYDKPVLHTKRLTLREMRPSDAPDLREWLSDPEIYRYWGQKPGKADKNPELMFENSRVMRSFHWGVVHNADNKVIGEMWVYLIERNRMAKIGIRMSRAYHSKGYGTEAMGAVVSFCFEKTELLRLWTDVDVRNTASWRVLEKNGFSREGLIRQGKLVNTFCDYYLYGMLKEDYTELKNSGKLK